MLLFLLLLCLFAGWTVHPITAYGEFVYRSSTKSNFWLFSVPLLVSSSYPTANIVATTCE